MNVFKRMFGANNKKGFEDDFFGKLEYEKKMDIYGKKHYSKNPKGNIHFYGVEIKIDLECDEKGPNQVQKDFFSQLQREFPSIVANKLTKLLNTELSSWYESPNHHVDFDKEMILNELMLPTCLEHPINWKLKLYHLHFDQFITLSFKGFEPDSKIKFEN